MGVVDRLSLAVAVCGCALLPGAVRADPLAVNPANGHTYEAVPVAAPYVSWTEANALAQARFHNGAQGYLASLTSAAENAFVVANLPSAILDGYWIGGFQDRTAPDYVEPAGGWRWTSGEPWAYTNWFVGGGAGGVQPDNGQGGREHFAHLHSGRFVGATGQWNDAEDLPGGFMTFTRGFVVEYDTAATVPEPASLTLGALGGLGLLGYGWRRKKGIHLPTRSSVRHGDFH